MRRPAGCGLRGRGKKRNERYQGVFPRPLAGSMPRSGSMWPRRDRAWVLRRVAGGRIGEQRVKRVGACPSRAASRTPCDRAGGARRGRALSGDRRRPARAPAAGRSDRPAARRSPRNRSASRASRTAREPRRGAGSLPCGMAMPVADAGGAEALALEQHLEDLASRRNLPVSSAARLASSCSACFLLVTRKLAIDAFGRDQVCTISILFSAARTGSRRLASRPAGIDPADIAVGPAVDHVEAAMRAVAEEHGGHVREVEPHDRLAYRHAVAISVVSSATITGLVPVGGIASSAPSSPCGGEHILLRFERRRLAASAAACGGRAAGACSGAAACRSARPPFEGGIGRIRASPWPLTKMSRPTCTVTSARNRCASRESTTARSSALSKYLSTTAMDVGFDMVAQGVAHVDLLACDGNLHGVSVCPKLCLPRSSRRGVVCRRAGRQGSHPSSPRGLSGSRARRSRS